MTNSTNGRKVYCVITDAAGNSVTTETVTLSIAVSNPLKIEEQPANVTVANGETAKTTVKATGDGLTYTWYYTSNKKSDTFYKSSNKTATYSAVMGSNIDGRKVYCVITDAAGNIVTTDIVTLSMGN